MLNTYFVLRWRSILKWLTNWCTVRIATLHYFVIFDPLEIERLPFVGRKGYTMNCLSFNKLQRTTSTVKIKNWRSHECKNINSGFFFRSSQTDGEVKINSMISLNEKNGIA